jgi:hypothetical protein
MSDLLDRADEVFKAAEVVARRVIALKTRQCEPIPERWLLQHLGWWWSVARTMRTGRHGGPEIVLNNLTYALRRLLWMEHELLKHGNLPGEDVPDSPPERQRRPVRKRAFASRGRER